MHNLHSNKKYLYYGAVVKVIHITEYKFFHVDTKEILKIKIAILEVVEELQPLNLYVNYLKAPLNFLKEYE